MGTQMLRTTLRLTLLSVLAFLALVWLEGPHGAGQSPSDHQMLAIQAASHHR
jgi:hypothetical protein